MNVVIFTGGQRPENCFISQKIKEMGGADYVIAADSGLDSAVEFMKNAGPGFTVDEIMGDMDSISSTKLIELFPSAKTNYFLKDKDFVDTELALFRAHEMCSMEESCILLVGGGGGRLDHLISILDTFNKPFHADVWLSDMQCVYYLPENSKACIKGVRKGENISVARLTGSYSKGEARTSGLQWEGNLFRREGMASTSNRISDLNERGEAVIEVYESPFLLILPPGGLISLKK